MSEDALERLRDMFRPKEESDVSTADSEGEDVPSGKDTPPSRQKKGVRLSRLKEARGVSSGAPTGVPAHYREWPPPDTRKLIQIVSATHPVHILADEEGKATVNSDPTVRSKFRITWASVTLGDGTAKWYPRTVFVLFGKHRGEKLKDLPGGYLRWLLDEDFHPFIKGFINAVLYWNND